MKVAVEKNRSHLKVFVGPTGESVQGGFSHSYKAFMVNDVLHKKIGKKSRAIHKGRGGGSLRTRERPKRMWTVSPGKNGGSQSGKGSHSLKGFEGWVSYHKGAISQGEKKKCCLDRQLEGT